MDWKAEIERQIRDNGWELSLATTKAERLGLARRKRIVVPIPPLRPLAMLLVKLIGKTNSLPFCGADPDCLIIGGFDFGADKVVHAMFDYGEEPYENPIDAAGNHLRPRIDFDAAFAKLSTPHDSPRNSRPG